MVNRLISRAVRDPIADVVSGIKILPPKKADDGDERSSSPFVTEEGDEFFDPSEQAINTSEEKSEKVLKKLKLYLYVHHLVGWLKLLNPKSSDGLVKSKPQIEVLEESKGDSWDGSV